MGCDRGALAQHVCGSHRLRTNLPARPRANASPDPLLTVGQPKSPHRWGGQGTPIFRSGADRRPDDQRPLCREDESRETHTLRGRARNRERLWAPRRPAACAPHSGLFPLGLGMEQTTCPALPAEDLPGVPHDQTARESGGDKADSAGRCRCPRMSPDTCRQRGIHDETWTKITDLMDVSLGGL